MKLKGVFIAGTDTGVGKTWVTTRLIEGLRSRGIRAVGMKPVECGGRDDSTAIMMASGGRESGLTLDEVNPVTFPEPLAPAAANPPIRLDFDRIRSSFETLANRYDCVIVEGAGGWYVPLDHERTMADLAAMPGLPVLVVAANRLGVLNHTLLTVRAIQAQGLECCGIFLNDLAADSDLSCQSNARVLREILPGLEVFDNDAEGLLNLF
jgi:dethiobiotin synthetase